MWQRNGNKYGAKKTIYNGRLYDSKGEAGLAGEIDLLIRAHEIIAVEPQITFKLYGRNGGQICKHIIDFLVTQKNGTKEAWEFKGMPTASWKLKRKLFEDNYPEIKYVTRK